jgi:hypothetical protein
MRGPLTPARICDERQSIHGRPSHRDRCEAARRGAMNRDLSLAIMGTLLRYHGRLPDGEIDPESLRAILQDDVAQNFLPFSAE